MKTHHRLAIVLSLLAAAPWVRAEVKPNSLFSNGAVLQQGMALPVWGTAKDGEKVTVQLDGGSAETVAKDGKWSVRLKPHKAGGPFTMTIAGENTITVDNMLVGEVWICSGQSNMEFGFGRAANAAEEAPKADYPKLRMFTVPHKNAVTPETDAAGTWVECSPTSVGRFSAVGYFFGRDIQKATGFPVGMIHTSVGGTPAQAWTSLSGLQADKELQGYVDSIKQVADAYPKAAEAYPKELADFQAKLKAWNESDAGKAYEASVKAWAEENKKAVAEGMPAIPKPQPAADLPKAPRTPEGGSGTPTVLFNGMVAPLVPYAIRGAIWYQGEANSANAKVYRTLFPRMIADWREKWGEGDFPFLFVQIAPHKNMSPEIREAQLLSWQKTPATAMAVTTDVGSATDIHPKQKEPVGARLALAARALAYGEKIEYSGPIFDTMKVAGNRATLTFKHTGTGLVAKDGELKGFTIAGADKKFVPAKAVIEGKTIIVSAEEVTAPVAVRFGWNNVPDVNLYNKEGLPASPFRSDVD
ncbi:MAG: sialate O-acetylesterase [Verrucomicrobiota bacterium]